MKMLSYVWEWTSHDRDNLQRVSCCCCCSGAARWVGGSGPSHRAAAEEPQEPEGRGETAAVWETVGQGGARVHTGPECKEEEVSQPAVP